MQQFESYILEFEDGTRIEDLVLNGSLFNTKKDIPNIYLDRYLTNVLLLDNLENIVKKYQMCKIIIKFITDDGYKYVLLDEDQPPTELEQLASKVDYLSMMTEIDI